MARKRRFARLSLWRVYAIFFFGDFGVEDMGNIGGEGEEEREDVEERK